MKSVLRCPVGVIGALLLAACGGCNAAASGVSMVPSALSVVAQSEQNLYVTSASPYFFKGYRLPLQTGEGPTLAEMGVNEPIPIVDDGRDLYVGSFDDGTIFTYPLPIVSNLEPQKSALAVAGSKEAPYIAPFSGRHSARPQGRPAADSGISSGLGDLSGLAVGGGYLYVAGESALGHEVLEYRLPFVSGEKPSGSVTGFSEIDFLGITARNHTLYIASTTAGTIGAYRLPLKKDEAPTYTIATIPQNDGAVGIAVDGDGRHLYLSLYAVGNTTSDVYEYRLPYQNGETPKSLNVALQTGERPYGIAVSEDHLFVGAISEIVSYRLPLNSRTIPDVILPYPIGGAFGIAAGK